MIRDIEQMLGELVRRHARQQRSADVQVSFGNVPFGNQSIRCLLDSVVQKFVSVLFLEDEPGADGLLEGHVHRLFRFL